MNGETTKRDKREEREREGSRVENSLRWDIVRERALDKNEIIFLVELKRFPRKGASPGELKASRFKSNIP